MRNELTALDRQEIQKTYNPVSEFSIGSLLNRAYIVALYLDRKELAEAIYQAYKIWIEEK